MRNWSIVRTGTTAAQKALFFNLRRLRAQIEKRGDALDDAGRRKIADELRVGIEDVRTMETRLAGSDQSLNAKVGEDGDEEWQSFLADDRPNPEDVVIQMRDARTRSQWLEEALQTLSERERAIVRQRHLDTEAVTLEALGKQLGISKERVRQLEARAMDKLKTAIVCSAGSENAQLFG